MSNLRTCNVCDDLHMCLNLIEGRCHKCTHKRVKELEAGIAEFGMGIRVLRDEGMKWVKVIIGSTEYLCALTGSLYNALPDDAEDLTTRVKNKIQNVITASLASWIIEIISETE